MSETDSRRASIFERFYLTALISAWCLAPGVRRLIDWQFGTTKLSVVSIVPMLALLPLLFIVFRKPWTQRYGLCFKALAYIWLFGFIYALGVAFAAKNFAGGVYDFAAFCLPMLVAAWVIARPSSRTQTFNTLTSTLLWLGVFESVYGIYQYIAPLPWDVEYVNNANQVTLGIPEPFALHPFSTINSPGALSVFLVLVILLNLHKLKLSRPLPLMAVTLSTAALILTNVRSAWLALAVGMLAYLILSPKRASAITSLLAVGVLSTLFVLNASLILGNSDVTAQLETRIGSLNGVNDDASLSARRAEADFALHQALAEPLGEGLGTVGTSAKLGGTLLDNGYLSRYLEMGIAGFASYLATIAFGLIVAVVALVRSIRNSDATLQQIAIYSLSIQAALIGLDSSSDFHNLLPGLFWWILLGLSIRSEPGDVRQHIVEESVSRRPRFVRPMWT